MIPTRQPFPGPRARLEACARRASVLRAEAAALRLELEQEEDLRHGAPRRYWWASSVCHRADLRARADEADAAAYWLEAEVDGRTRSLEAATRTALLGSLRSSLELAVDAMGPAVPASGVRAVARTYVERGTVRVDVDVRLPPVPGQRIPVTITKAGQATPAREGDAVVGHAVLAGKATPERAARFREVLEQQRGKPFSWHTSAPAFDVDLTRWWERVRDAEVTPTQRAQAWRYRAQQPRPLRWEPWPTVQDGTRKVTTIHDLLAAPDVVRQAIRQLEQQWLARTALGLGTPTIRLAPPTRRQRARSALRRAGEWLRGRS